MPTTITSAGITFNDATSLTSANIGTAQLVNGSVTAAKLGTTEQTRIAKAWVNFDGTTIQANSAAASGVVLSVTSGSNTGTWVSSVTWGSNWVGQRVLINSIAGVSGATFGGLNVATSGFQITSVSGGTANVVFLAGNATSSQTITGTGSASTGYVFSTYGIRSSYNVSSVTKNGTGDYTVNFTTAMSDANYSVNITSGRLLTDFSLVGLKSITANGFTFNTTGTGGVGSDATINCASIFGN